MKSFFSSISVLTSAVLALPQQQQQQQQGGRNVAVRVSRYDVPVSQMQGPAWLLNATISAAANQASSAQGITIPGSGMTIRMYQNDKLVSGGGAAWVVEISKAVHQQYAAAAQPMPDVPLGQTINERWFRPVRPVPVAVPVGVSVPAGYAAPLPAGYAAPYAAPVPAPATPYYPSAYSPAGPPYSYNPSSPGYVSGYSGSLGWSVPDPTSLLGRLPAPAAAQVPVIGGAIGEPVGAFIGSQIGRALGVPVGHFIGQVIGDNLIGARWA